MKVKCMNKVRDGKGNIVKYQLMDENGNKIEATSKEIKAEIKAGKYEFINLQIDKAGRLVDKATAKDKTAKTKQATVKTKQEALQEKKNQAKEEVKDYIELMKKEYTCEHGGCEKFIRDFTGEGNIILGKDKNGKVDIKTMCRMSPATKNYFEIMIKQIEDKALKDKIIASRYDCTALRVVLPESVEKFMQSAGLDDCIAEAMFYKAAQNKKLALIKCGIDTDDGFIGNMILTANYDKAKRFMLEKAGEEARNTEQRTKNIILEGNYVQGDNMLGRVFIIKLIAKLQKHDIDCYKSRVLRKAYTNSYEYEGKCIADLNIEEQTKVIGRTLRGETCGLSYLALKLGVLPQLYDYDAPPEEKEIIEDKITAEAKRLAEQTEYKLQVFKETEFTEAVRMVKQINDKVWLLEKTGPKEWTYISIRSKSSRKS